MKLSKKNLLKISLILAIFLTPTFTQAATKLNVSAWIPYWAKTAGASTTIAHINLVDEIHPFAYEIQTDGSIKDKLKLDQTPYKEAVAAAKSAGVKVTPTFLWTGPSAMYKLITNPDSLSKHIDEIIKTAQSSGADGVDIDYEGKRMEDKNLYAYFTKFLSQNLKKNNLSLSCTIEAESTAAPDAHLLKIKATSPWSNDLPTLNKYCDTVRLMAYDQMPQTTTSKWTAKNGSTYAPNADIAWVKKVLNYNLKYIDKKKLVLGIPTYGWETEVTKGKTSDSFEIMRSLSYQKFYDTASSTGSTIKRDISGELKFTYIKNGKTRIAYLHDAVAIKQGMDLAKKLGIKGVTLFKFDGGEDPDLWNVLSLR